VKNGIFVVMNSESSIKNVGALSWRGNEGILSIAPPLLVEACGLY
jgi:hypothetical protein